MTLKLTATPWGNGLETSQSFNGRRSRGSVKSNGTHKVRRSGVWRQPNQECFVFLLSFFGYADILRPG